MFVIILNLFLNRIFLFIDNVSRWERTVNDEEEKLETCKKQEAKQRDEIDKDLQQVEQLKALRLNKKQEVEAAEEEVGKARREVGAVAKDVQAAQKSVVSLEGKIESKKSERHTILMQCKVSRSGHFFYSEQIKDFIFNCEFFYNDFKY